MEIKTAILHILDLEGGSLICSKEPLVLNDYAVKTYLAGCLKKFKAADLKTGHLPANNDIVTILKDSSLDFINQSEAVAMLLYNCLKQGQEIPSGDLLCYLGEEMDQTYFGVVKLNYKPAYTHYVDYEGENLFNNLIINQTILPNVTQKVEEGFRINLETLEFELIEKNYLFDGKKAFYLSDLVLKAEVTPTVQDNLKIVKKAVKEIADKYNEEKYVSFSNVQQAVYESIETEGKLSNEKIAEAVFEGNHTAKAEYLERVEQTKFVEDIPINVPKYEKKYSKQKLKLANGIELTIPIDVYQDKELIEFINNPDGTISVMIKNVDDIINKF